MKRYLKIIFPILALGVIIFSCTKKYDQRVAVAVSSSSGAFLKVIHAAPSFRKVFNSPDTFNIIVGGVNGTRMVSALTYNGAFPSNSININTYASVPANSQDIRLVIKGVTNIDSNTIAVIPKNLAAGNKYTLIITDSIASVADYSKIFVQDNLPAVDTGKFALRFIHAVMNDTAGKKVDVYSFRYASNIFSNASPGDVTTFNTLAIPATLDTFSIRRAGTTNELYRLNGVSFTNNQRVYTLIYRGDGTLTSGTKARGAFIYTNQ